MSKELDQTTLDLLKTGAEAQQPDKRERNEGQAKAGDHWRACLSLK